MIHPKLAASFYRGKIAAQARTDADVSSIDWHRCLPPLPLERGAMYYACRRAYLSGWYKARGQLKSAVFNLRIARCISECGE